MNFKKNLLSSGGFTIPELVISVVISAIVVLGLMTFLGSIQSAIADSSRKASVFSELGDFLTEIRDLRSKNPKTVLYDTATGYDTVLVTSLDSKNGYLIGVVDFTSPTTNGSYRFDAPANFSTYGNKVLAIAPVSAAEISGIVTSTGASIVTVPVYPDSIYPNLHVSDFQVKLYNAGTIVDAFIRFRNTYLPNFVARPTEEVPNVTPLDYAINF